MTDKEKNKIAGTAFNDCSECNGCISCDEAYCIFNSGGNPENCNIEKCRYCVSFSRKQRLFLGNVG